MTEKSIFTKIIEGEVPSNKIYEDDKTYAFLDIHPVQPGHVLVVPKAQVDLLWDLEDGDYHDLMVACKKIAKEMGTRLGKRIGVQVMGLDVPHAHIHLIPFSSAKEFRAAPEDLTEPDYAALTAMADKLKIKDE